MKLLAAIPVAELKPGVEYTAVVHEAGDLLALFAKHEDASRWQASDDCPGAVRLIEVRAVP